ncbi:hypothetical protein [Pasteurella multocida]|uniref:hypothetical protein n=1 Tax=Pasteurella multocida TaxID=747 RepID=UPI00159BCED5|nr:hypothetical protein [Pasteurella multocida]MDY0480154.1 hypothetical protein [Pasteurella multocida]MDY0581222.1 hypothetical protein [Pasteurella multocida]MDY0606264.1 hypothetical protein [Pasteurella multocida]WEO86703.1 hypothetical protein M9D40_003925 [Pasteurella multocida]HDR1324237.1 hypothetical protein [Pasteurella multocida]
MTEKVNRKKIDRIYAMKRKKKLRQLKKWIFNGEIDTSSIYQILQKYDTAFPF